MPKLRLRHTTTERHPGLLTDASWQLAEVEQEAPAPVLRPAAPRSKNQWLPLASVSQQQLQHVAEQLLDLASSVLGQDASSEALAQGHLTGGERLRQALKVWGGHDLRATFSLERVLELGGVLAAGAAVGLSPQGPGRCDHNALERCANCVTSLPYVVAGAHSCCCRRAAMGKAYGGAMIAVGAASTAFHATPPTHRWRSLTRKLDFWSIAACSTIMARACFPGLPAAVTALSLLATPFRPFAVSFVNTTAMEMLFLQRARQAPEQQRLRRAQRVHAATCVAGLGAFALEDLAPRLPFMHAAWHVLSASAVFSVNALLADLERERLVQGLPEASQRRPSLLVAAAAPLQ